MKKLLLLSSLCLLLQLTAWSQTTPKLSKSSTETTTRLNENSDKANQAWKATALTLIAQRDSNAVKLADTTAALHVVRTDQPKKLEMAFKQGKKEGKKTGFLWGLGSGVITLLAILISSK